MRSLHQSTLRAATFCYRTCRECHAVASPDVRADNGDGDESKIKQGLRGSPVPLNLRGKNRALVGLGSYIVNAQSACNDCHTQPNYAQGGDPFKGETEQINVAGYLGGGRVFFGPIISAI